DTDPLLALYWIRQHAAESEVHGPSRRGAGPPECGAAAGERDAPHPAGGRDRAAWPASRAAALCGPMAMTNGVVECYRCRTPVPEHSRYCSSCGADVSGRSEEHTSELQSRGHLVCRLLLEKKKTKKSP